MVEVGAVMDAMCQKSGEWGGARRCPEDQYQHSVCVTLHMHLMNQQFYLLITHGGTHLSIPHTVLNRPGRPDNGQLLPTTNLQTASTFLYFHPLTLSLPLLPELPFVAGNSPCNALHAVWVNVMHFFFCPLTT